MRPRPRNSPVLLRNWLLNRKPCSSSWDFSGLRAKEFRPRYADPESTNHSHTFRRESYRRTNPTARPSSTTSPGSKRRTQMQIKRDVDNREKEQDVKQYLTFMIGGEEYAIGLLKVKEIIEYDTVTEVPKTPEWVRGVINLPASVVPVIDLPSKFSLPPTLPRHITRT